MRKAQRAYQWFLPCSKSRMLCRLTYRIFDYLACPFLHFLRGFQQVPSLHSVHEGQSEKEKAIVIQKVESHYRFGCQDSCAVRFLSINPMASCSNPPSAKTLIRVRIVASSLEFQAYEQRGVVTSRGRIWNCLYAKCFSVPNHLPLTSKYSQMYQKNCKKRYDQSIQILSSLKLNSWGADDNQAALIFQTGKGVCFLVGRLI